MAPHLRSSPKWQWKRTVHVVYTMCCQGQQLTPPSVEAGVKSTGHSRSRRCRSWYRSYVCCLHMPARSGRGAKAPLNGDQALKGDPSVDRALHTQLPVLPNLSDPT